MAEEDIIYNIPPKQPGLTADDVREIVADMLKTFSIPSKMSGSYLQSANFVTGVQGWQLRPDGAEVQGTFSVSEINIPNPTTASSFHVNSFGDTWWGANVADFNADPANALARIMRTGEAHFANINVTGGTIPAAVISGLPPATVDISAQDWTFSGLFSATDADTVSWTAGSLKFSEGTNYAIVAGNTGNMSAKTYIYINNAVSTTVLQVTTNPATAVGTGKVLIAVAENGTTTSTFAVMNDKSRSINATDIVAGSITGNKIAAGTIAVGNLAADSVSSVKIQAGSVTSDKLSANIIYGGVIEVSGSGNIHSGQTAFDTGLGWFIGTVGGTPKLSIGDSAGNKLTFDGVNVNIVGNLNVASVLNTASYTVDNLPTTATVEGPDPPQSIF